MRNSVSCPLTLAELSFNIFMHVQIISKYGGKHQKVSATFVG